MPIEPVRLVLSLLALIGLATGAAAADAARVDNGAKPAGGDVVLRLAESWRIGGADDDENLFGVVDRVIADDAGNLYLLDVQLTEVQVFAPDGSHLRTLGKAGDGPGELRRASEVLLLPDGTIGMVQAFPGRIVKLSPDGLPAGELRPGGDDPTAGGMFLLRSAQVSGKRLVCSGARMSRGETTRTARHFLSAFGLDGAEQVQFHSLTTERQMGRSEIQEAAEFFPHEGSWTALPDGRVVVAPLRNEYRLEIHAPDGALERIVTRKYDSWRRTAEDKAEVAAMAGGFGGRNRDRPDFVVEPTERDILQVRTGPGGTIWVLPSRGVRQQPAGIHSTWDVFDAAGAWQRRVSVACDGDGRRDALFFTGDGRAVLVREHAEALRAFRGQARDRQDAGQAAEPDLEAEPLEIVVYRILD